MGNESGKPLCVTLGWRVSLETGCDALLGVVGAGCTEVPVGGAMLATMDTRCCSWIVIHALRASGLAWHAIGCAGGCFDLGVAGYSHVQWVFVAV